MYLQLVYWTMGIVFIMLPSQWALGNNVMMDFPSEFDGVDMVKTCVMLIK